LSSRNRGLRVALTTLAVTSLVVLGHGVASADEHGGVKDVVRDVRTGLEQGADQQRQWTPAAPSTTDEQTTADGDDATPEKGEARAKAEAAKVGVGGQDVADVARSEAATKGDDSAQSDATLLAIGGQEVMGAHASSNGEEESHAGNPFAQICEASGGQLCLAFLFADAWADETDDSSDSLAQTGVLDACLAGDSTDRRADCNGQLSAKVLASKAQTHRDKSNGQTRSDAESAAADVCAAPGEDGTCGLGAEVLKAKSSSSSDGQASGESTVVGLEVGGQEVITLKDPTNVDIQPECAEPSALCVAANKGESSVGDGIASQSQDALDAGVLPDTAGGDLGLSRTETVASAGEVAPQEQPPAEETGSPQAGDNGDNGGEAAGVLPNTGGVGSGVLAAALAAIAAGSFLVARRRRRADGLV
jgi:LPXTG-motif cell wall-anchored protein